MSSSRDNNLVDHLRLVSSASNELDIVEAEAKPEFSSLIDHCLKDFVRGNVGRARTGISTLTQYAISWPDEHADIQAQLRACEMAFLYWQKISNLESLGRLFWASRQISDPSTNPELLLFVFGAIADDLLERKLFADMREHLAWAKSWSDYADYRDFIHAYELILAVRESGAAAVRTELAAHVKASTQALFHPNKFRFWFPLFLSGLALSEYELSRGNFALANKHVSFAKSIASQAQAPFMQVKALELEAGVACQAKDPHGMYEAQMGIHAISKMIDLGSHEGLARSEVKTNDEAPVSQKLSELPCGVSLENGTVTPCDAKQFLSSRERRILQHVKRGQRNKEIARALHISEDTIKYHLKNVFSKLGVNKRMDAIRVAQEQGYLSVFC